MLRINRIKIEITTENGIYGFDTPFVNGLNFLSSQENTCGKSSILEAIYYCLGLEEIIGGRNEKVLTSVFKTTLEDNTSVWNVLQSCAYLEISNGKDVVTLYRTAKMTNRDSRMITVYYSDMDGLSNPDTLADDKYVHFPNSAINPKGFHYFLEKFLFLELPQVIGSDNTQKKLYLQLVFSCMFIEQKHGWSDLFSGMPILGIKESKKRVIEFVLQLDTLKNEKKKEDLKINEALIIEEWNKCFDSLQIMAAQENCTIINYPVRPNVLSDIDVERIAIQNDGVLIKKEIENLEKQTSEIQKLKPKVIDNFEELQGELSKTEESMTELDGYVSSCQKQLLIEKGNIKTINENLETIEIDLTNNKDAARLRDLGSELQCNFAKDVCPVCHQHINDSLLPKAADIPVMGIDENIRHLEAQQKMLKFSLLSHIQRKKELEMQINEINDRLYKLRRLAQTIRNDLYSINESYSETVVYKKITLKQRIDGLKKLQMLLIKNCKELKILSGRWQIFLEDRKQVPKNKFTALDKEKLDLLKEKFIDNLKLFGYRSIHDFDAITISEESYLPLFEGFDMKFDSSASDNIRLIWSFTLALLQVSVLTSGNHPTVLIFDEPDQQSTIISDMKSFFEKILDLADYSQVIVGITIKDGDTKKAIQELPENSYLQIDVPNKAFKKK